VRWIAAVATLVRGEPYQLPRLHGVHFDITRRKMAADSLRQNEHRLRMILNNALDGIVTINAEGAIADWNAEALRIFGWTKRKRWEKFCHHHHNSPELQRVEPEFSSTHAHRASSMLNRRMEITALPGRE